MYGGSLICATETAEVSAFLPQLLLDLPSRNAEEINHFGNLGNRVLSFPDRRVLYPIHLVHVHLRYPLILP